MLQWITHTVGSLGYAGIAFLMFLENIVLPLPSEVIMPLAGFVTARGSLSFPGVVVSGAAGSTLGMIPWYVIGRRVGEKRLAAWVDRHGRWLMLRGRQIDRAKRWFDRHGRAAAFFGRLIPGVRPLTSIPAGFDRMPFLPFLGYSAAGILVWSAALAIAGRLLGAHYRAVARVIGPAAWVVLGAAAIGATAWWLRRRRARGRRASRA